MAFEPNKKGGVRRHIPLPAFYDAKSRSAKAKRAAAEATPSKVRELAEKAASQTRVGERYFVLRNGATGETLCGYRYADEAKKHRNRLNTEAGSPTLWRMCRGPDVTALLSQQANENGDGC